MFLNVASGDREDDLEDFVLLAFPAIKQQHPNGGGDPLNHDDGDDNDTENRRTTF